MWRADIQQQHDQLQSTAQSIELALAAVPLLTVPQATAVQESLSAAAGTHIELGQVRADILSQQQLCSELGGKTSQMQQQLSRIINDQPRRKLAVRTLPGTTAAQVRSALESAGQLEDSAILNVTKYSDDIPRHVRTDQRRQPLQGPPPGLTPARPVSGAGSSLAAASAAPGQVNSTVAAAGAVAGSSAAAAAGPSAAAAAEPARTVAAAVSTAVGATATSGAAVGTTAAVGPAAAAVGAATAAGTPVNGKTVWIVTVGCAAVADRLLSPTVKRQLHTAHGHNYFVDIWLTEQQKQQKQQRSLHQPAIRRLVGSGTPWRWSYRDPVQLSWKRALAQPTVGDGA